jgi:integrase
VRGSIFKRKDSETWTIKYDLPRDPATGKRRPKWQGGFRTETDAQRALTKVLSQLDEGTLAEPTKQTVGEFLINDWLPSLQTRGLRPNTMVSYRETVKKQIVPRLGGVLIQKLTPVHLNTFYADLLREGRRDGEGGLSARSVRYSHTILRRALADAMKWGRLTRNVADAADPPEASAARRDAQQARNFWSPEELGAFFQHARSHRLGAAFYLAGNTGLRRGEVLGLRWRDLDLDNPDGPRLSVTQTVVSPDRKIEFSTPKTGHGRVVSLDPATVEVLRQHRVTQAKERLALGAGFIDHDLVFCHVDGQPIQPNNLSQTFDRLIATSKLRRVRLHDLRHTHASLALRANVHPKIVQTRLGHANIAITMDTYSHVAPGQDLDAARLVASLVAGASVAPVGSPATDE